MSSIHPIFNRLPPPAETLAILIGCMEVSLFGLGGLANPFEFAKGYGLPFTSTTQPGRLQASEEAEKDTPASKQQRALVAAIASRNIQNGVCLLAFGAYWRDRRALGTVVASGLVTTLADLLLVEWYGDKSAIYGHIFGVCNSLIIGGSLLFL